MDPQTEKLLEAICNYKTLPAEEQKILRPTLVETIERHKELLKCHSVIDKYLKNTDLYKNKGE